MVNSKPKNIINIRITQNGIHLWNCRKYSFWHREFFAAEEKKVTRSSKTMVVSVFVYTMRQRVNVKYWKKRKKGNNKKSAQLSRAHTKLEKKEKLRVVRMRVRIAYLDLHCYICTIHRTHHCKANVSKTWIDSKRKMLSFEVSLTWTMRACVCVCVRAVYVRVSEESVSSCICFVPSTNALQFYNWTQDIGSSDERIVRSSSRITRMW